MSTNIFIEEQEKKVAPTPDPDFGCFYPCEIILFHILAPALKKDKNEQLHVGRTLSARCSVTSLQ